MGNTASTLILQVDVARQPGRAVVVAAGEIDASVIQIFREALRTAIAFEEPKVLVDLTQVEYMDSGVIYALLDVWNALGRRPDALQLNVGLNTAARIVQTVGLDRLMAVERE